MFYFGVMKGDHGPLVARTVSVAATGGASTGTLREKRTTPLRFTGPTLPHWLPPQGHQPRVSGCKAREVSSGASHNGQSDTC